MTIYICDDDGCGRKTVVNGDTRIGKVMCDVCKIPMNPLRSRSTEAKLLLIVEHMAKGDGYYCQDCGQPIKLHKREIFGSVMGGAIYADDWEWYIATANASGWKCSTAEVFKIARLAMESNARRIVESQVFSFGADTKPPISPPNKDTRNKKRAKKEKKKS